MAVAQCPATARRNCDGRGDPLFIESYANFLAYGRDGFRVDKLDKITHEMKKPAIVSYFISVRESLRRMRKSTGATATRSACTALAIRLLGDDNKLADYFWISPEGRNDPEYRQFLEREGHWHLVHNSIPPDGGPRPSIKTGT